MKLSLPLAITLSFAALTLTAAPKNFAGRWTLDLESSKNLPRGYQRVKSQVPTVAQTPEHLSVAIDVQREEADATQQSFEFDLNGKPTESESKMHTPNGDQKIAMLLKGTLRDDGKIELVQERQLKTPQAARTLTTVELWELSGDGQTLTIHRRDEMQGGALQFDLVFKR